MQLTLLVLSHANLFHTELYKDYKVLSPKSIPLLTWFQPTALNKQNFMDNSMILR